MIDNENKMTKEVKNKLFSLLPMSTDGRHSFVPEIFVEQGIPVELHPTIIVRQFTNGEKDKCKALAVAKVLANQNRKSKPSAQKIVDDARRETEEYSKLANACITGWSNMTDSSSGKPVAYTADSIIEQDVIVGSCLAEIMKISGMVPLEEKKEDSEEKDGESEEKKDK